MSGHVGDLSPKQAEVLQKFRETMKDVLKPHHDDYFLTRWLRARNYDLKKAETMLRNDFTWRAQNGVDTILSDYKVPEVIEKYYPGGLCGRDKEGCPIWIDPFGDMDIKGMLSSARKQDVIKSKVHLLERIYKLFEAESTESRRVNGVILIYDLEKMGLKHLWKPGDPDLIGYFGCGGGSEDQRVDGIVVIFDLEKMGLKHLWKPGVDLFNSILAIFEEHFPESLKKSFVINAPRIFPIAFNLVRPFLSEATVKKVHILGSNYKEELLKHIDADQLPVYWGGTKTDPDGNIKCPSQICLGGEIPQKYYSEVLSNLDGFTEVDLGRGSSLQLDYEIKVPQSVIRWQFKTDGFDIGFGIFKRTKNKRQKAGAMDEVVASDRVNSHLIPEDGSTTCTDVGTYVIRFDNTYSWTRGKTLFYLIEVLEPDVTDLDIQTD